MFFKNLFTTKARIKGDIGYYNLQDWWFQEFTEEERKEIEDTYKPMGAESSRPLTQPNIDWSSQSVTGFLSMLAGWFNNPRQRELANRIMAKAAEAAQHHQDDILDIHFLYSEMIPLYYPQRDKEGMLGKVIEACRKQIAIAPQAAKAFLKEYPDQDLPSHRGYEQLVIILDKQGKQQEAIALCQQAKHQKWAGDWDKRIGRYMEKSKRLKNKP